MSAPSNKTLNTADELLRSAEKQKQLLQAKIEALKSQLNELQNINKNNNDVGASDKKEEKNNSRNNQTLIVVANRLPVSMQRTNNKWNFKPSAGGLVTALKQLGNLNMEWVGCPGYIEISQRNFIQNELLKYNVYPVFVDKRDYDNYYNGYCNGILWPLFHYIELSDDIVPYFNKFYNAYSKINLLFSNIINKLIIKKIQSGVNINNILIWIHDYHLMLLPEYIRRFRRDSIIGFFLHIPFPTYEQFRLLPNNKSLLQGVLSSNLIGFHIHDYSQHFRQACSHILCSELLPESVISKNGRLSIISTFPIGTDINKWRNGLKRLEILKLIKKYKSHHLNKKIILGVDRLDLIKGIPHKLYAFSKFLESNPSMRDKVVFIQIAVPSRQTAPQYIKLTKKCNELVGKINSKYSSFSSVPIHFLYQSFGFNDLVALYNVSSVCLVTSLRDGMNLVSYEYISCQNMNDPGVLIVSKFAGSAQSLGAGSIIINPWDIAEVSSALKQALTMNINQRKQYQLILYKIIKKNTVQHWANTFIQSLKISYLKCPQNAPIVPSPINTYSILNNFNKKDGKKIIILGLGGTLIARRQLFNINLDEYTTMKCLSDKLKKSINILSTNNIIVAIVSSLPRKSLDVLLNGVKCIQYAENGYYYKDTTCTTTSGSAATGWSITTNYTDNSWKDEVLKIMKYFQERTPNTTLDNLTSFVSFRYNVAESTKTTSLQATSGIINNVKDNISQCVTSLQTGPLQSSYARLVHDTSDGHIQVRQPGISKLSAVTRLTQQFSNISYILCCADFLSFDEEVFVYLNGLQEELLLNTNNNNNPDTIIGGILSSSDLDASDNSTTDEPPIKRIGSSSSLQHMYVAANKEQIKYSSKTDDDDDQNNKNNTNLKNKRMLSPYCKIDTIKVTKAATRADHYIHDVYKVEDLLFQISSAIKQQKQQPHNSPVHHTTTSLFHTSKSKWYGSNPSLYKLSTTGVTLIENPDDNNNNNNNNDIGGIPTGPPPTATGTVTGINLPSAPSSPSSQSSPSSDDIDNNNITSYNNINIVHGGAKLINPIHDNNNNNFFNNNNNDNVRKSADLSSLKSPPDTDFASKLLLNENEK